MKAQAAIEGILVIAGILLLALVGLRIVSLEKEQARGFELLQKNWQDSIGCAAIVNSIFSNSADFAGENAHCFADANGFVKSTQEKPKSVKTIARELSNSRIGNRDFLEVKRIEHYK